jgi:O-antigen/teichoic acid export membrane protein
MKLTRSALARQMLVTWATLVSSLVFVFCARALIARDLGPTAMGIYALMLTVALLGGTFLSLGLPAYNAAFAMEQRPEVLLANCLLWNGLVFCLLSAVCPLVLEFGDLPRSREFLVVGLWMAPLMSMMECLRGVLQGAGAMRAYNVVGFIGGALNLSGVVVLTFTGRLGLGAASICWVVSVAASLLIGLYGFTRGKGLARPDVQLLGRSLKFGGQAWLSQMTGVLNIRLALVLIEWLLGTAAVGIYSIAATISEVLLYLPYAVAAVAAPRFAQATRLDAARLLVRAGAAVLALNAVCALVLALVADPVLPLVFGAQYAGAAPILRALLPGVVLYSPVAVAAWYFNAHLKRPAINMVVVGFSAACGSLLILLLAPRFGLVGVGVATTCGYTAAAILNMVLLRRTSHLSYARFLEAARVRPDAMPPTRTRQGNADA